LKPTKGYTPPTGPQRLFAWRLVKKAYTDGETLSDPSQSQLPNAWWLTYKVKLAATSIRAVIGGVGAGVGQYASSTPAPETVHCWQQGGLAVKKKRSDGLATAKLELTEMN
jgi:putative hemolysin